MGAMIGLADALGLFNTGKPSIVTPSSAPANQVGGSDGKNYDPNAPLSQMIEGAGQNQNTFAQGEYSRKDPGNKLQFQGDILSQLGIQNQDIGTQLQAAPLNYWQSILKPPTRQSLAEQEGPALASVIAQYQTGKQGLANAPRSAGTAALAAELPFQEAGATTSLLEQQLSQTLNVLQPEAAAAISGIAKTISDLGFAQMGLSAQDLATALSAKITKSGQNQQTLSSLGQGIGQLVAALIQSGG